jgi:predicted SnoaL-like aldol condensation-catalyzing enzyme
MIEIVNPNHARAVRNKGNVLALYDAMINNKNSEEAVSKFLVPNYIQHNPLVPDGAAGLAGFFDKMTKDRANLHVVVHRIIAVGDYVWAHVNFINLFSDDPQDRGIAGVDLYRMNAEGKAVEHWDVLQEIGDPENAAHANGMF